MGLKAEAIRRDGKRCQACGNAARPTLAAHHIVPVQLGGADRLSNLTTLCANCHRMVHWLGTGNRSSGSHAFGLGAEAKVTRRLLKLARRIRRERERRLGPGLVFKDAIPVQMAIAAVSRRNGLERSDEASLKRAFGRVWRSIHPKDRAQCSVRLPRGERFLSVLANNYLVFRGPAWSDYGERLDADLLLIWPKELRPSVLSRKEYAKVSGGSFDRIPCTNLPLHWDECLALSREDLRAFRSAVHDALTLHRTRRWPSNVIA